ncbi:uncharacterized protein, partial [Littorina saxatilis]|uniref:uncharacterized protein n=1 Tax=Littorina saxatilis TaxID=31220 RepID=UPI0038B6A818
MMRGAPDRVTVVLLCVLVLTVQAGTVRIKECSSGSVTQDENHTPAYLTCDGFTPNDTITWRVNNKNTSPATSITCPPQNTTCGSADEVLFVTRTARESRLRISGNYRLREGENGIMCTAENQTATQTVACTFNVVAEARLSNCQVTLNAADWTVSGRCRFEGAYSSTGIFTCTWHQDQPDTTITGVVDKMAIDMHQGVYYN